MCDREGWKRARMGTLYQCGDCTEVQPHIMTRCLNAGADSMASPLVRIQPGTRAPSIASHAQQRRATRRGGFAMCGVPLPAVHSRHAVLRGPRRSTLAIRRAFRPISVGRGRTQPALPFWLTSSTWLGPHAVGPASSPRRTRALRKLQEALAPAERKYRETGRSTLRQANGRRPQPLRWQLPHQRSPGRATSTLRAIWMRIDWRPKQQGRRICCARSSWRRRMKT